MSTDLGVLVPVAVAAVTGIVPYLGYRLSRRSADRRDSAEGTQTVLAGFTALLGEAKAARDELRDRVYALEEQSRERDGRIAQLEQGRADDHRRITAAVRYIRTLRRFITSLGEVPPRADDDALANDLTD